MGDRLALANVIEEAGIERAKAERVASVIFDAINSNVATKADVQAVQTRLLAEHQTVRTELRAELQAARSELRTEIQMSRSDLKADIARADAKLGRVGRQLLTRLGGLVVALAVLLLAALHYLPLR